MPMERASEKAERQAMARLRPQLESRLSEQRSLLEHLGRLYDDTTPAAALPLATCLRVLLHHTDRSHALLHQLGELDGTMFVDTA